MKNLHIPIRLSQDDFNCLMTLYDNYDDFEEVLQDLISEYIYDKLKESI